MFALPVDTIATTSAVASKKKNTTWGGGEETRYRWDSNQVNPTAVPYKIAAVLAQQKQRYRCGATVVTAYGASRDHHHETSNGEVCLCPSEVVHRNTRGQSPLSAIPTLWTAVLVNYFFHRKFCSVVSRKAQEGSPEPKTSEALSYRFDGTITR